MNQEVNTDQYYKILNISTTASQKEIHKAYLKLMKYYYAEYVL
jgi:DnaJ-class molecular chaperone